MQTRCVQIASTVFHSCHQCDNIDRLNKYKQQITNNLQLYSCARSQHAHAIRVNWLNIITTCTLDPIQWELAKNEGHSIKFQTILH